eukprot:1121752-Ditylum_brightwellii.AAC.1
MRTRPIRRGRRSRKNSADTKRTLNTDFEEEKKTGPKEKISKKDQMEQPSTSSSEDDKYKCALSSTSA